VFAWLIIAVAAFLAGAINAIAGGGTLISFPALLWIGRNPIMANATNAVALWPGSLAAAYGFRRELAPAKRWLAILMLPSLGGAALGAYVLMHTSTRTFSHLVPFLILGATLLLAAQEVIARRLRTIAKHDGRGWTVFVVIFQFFVGLYGGYFGAGMGILMLAALGLIGLTDMHQMNGIKNLLAVFINGIAAVYFAFSHAIIWSDGAVMAVASIAGGIAGARLAHRFGRKFVRTAVVVIGIVMAIALMISGPKG
jgi:uncharacterized membrane protein YfcA